MKKRKIIAVMATLLSVAVIATACKSTTEETKKKSKKDKDDEDIEDVIDDDDDDDDDDDEETKKTKKTKKTTTTEEETTTTEEPTTTTTEEPTTTTTEEPTTTTTAESTEATTVDLGDKTQYTEGIYSYTFTNEWQALAKGGYQYFFKDQSQATSNFMMIYSQKMMSGSQLQAYGYEKALNEYNQGIASSFGADAQIVSCDMHVDGDKDIYEDIVITGTYNNDKVELSIHVIFDKESGDAFVFCMYMKADLSDAEKSDIMAIYNDCIASITRIG